MPTEEQLELTASFVDEASRGIARLRADLNQLTTGTGKAQLEAFRRGQEETSKKIKELAEAATGGDKALISFAGKLGLAGVAAGTVGVALHAGLEGLKAYSDKMVDLGNKARVMGVPAAELKSVVEQFERLGVPAALVEQSVAQFADKLGSLGRIGSAERQEMIVAAGTFRNEMARAIQKIEEQDQLSDKLNIALELGQIVFNNRLKETRGNVADATKAENDFLALLGINPMLKHLENLDAISAADRKIIDQRNRNASEFHKALSDLNVEQEKWADDIKDSFLTADGLVMRGLRGAVAQMQALGEGGRIVPGGQSIIGYWLGRAAGLPETGLLRHKGTEPAPARLLGETLAPGPAGAADDGSFGAAAERYGRIFGYSTNIEDRRNMVERAAPRDDLAEAIAGNTEEMKKLNDALALLTRPDISLEGLQGLPGFGRGGARGGTTPGGGGGGGETPGGGGGGGGQPGKGEYNVAKAYDLIKAAGGTDEEARTLAAISQPESGGNPRAHNTNASTGDNSYGLWQINMLGAMGPERRRKFGLKSNEDLFDPATNARVALQMHRERGGYGDWTTYTSGKYRRYLSRSDPGGGGRATPAPDNSAAAPGSTLPAPGFKPISGSLSDLAPDSPEAAENKRLKETWQNRVDSAMRVAGRGVTPTPLIMRRATPPQAAIDQADWAQTPNTQAPTSVGGGTPPSVGLQSQTPRVILRIPDRPPIDRSDMPAPIQTDPGPGGNFGGRLTPISDDRARIDRGAERDMKVDMSGTLSADVNAPRGSKVTLEGGGLFSKTELSRQTPLGRA